MAVQDIIQYIQTNQKQFPQETLIENLKKGGYPEAEIQEALRMSADQKSVQQVPLSMGKKVGQWFLGVVIGIITFWMVAWIASFAISEALRFSGVYYGYYAFA